MAFAKKLQLFMEGIHINETQKLLHATIGFLDFKWYFMYSFPYAT